MPTAVHTANISTCASLSTNIAGSLPAIRSVHFSSNRSDVLILMALLHLIDHANLVAWMQSGAHPPLRIP
jgi:hypothetical protein